MGDDRQDPVVLVRADDHRDGKVVGCEGVEGAYDQLGIALAEGPGMPNRRVKDVQWQPNVNARLFLNPVIFVIEVAVVPIESGGGSVRIGELFETR